MKKAALLRGFFMPVIQPSLGQCLCNHITPSSNFDHKRPAERACNMLSHCSTPLETPLA
ncbi:hypothetical protein PMI22_04674 [Pseudomonas sp. GM21]|nr:hypothetical protein PMI22_04674 [Pseudomonas sp. GM21]